MDDAWELRYRIYRHLADTGEAPPRAALDAWTGSADTTDRWLDDLHERHAIVLDDGAIRMALPFSAVPTDHRVIAANRSWWANCAWDALAIPVLLGVDARIEASWVDGGEPVGLAVAGGELSSTEGWVHYAVPAERWWDDIVET